MRKPFSTLVLSAVSVLAFQSPQILFAQNNSFEKCNRLKDPIEFRECITKSQSNDKVISKSKYDESLNFFELGDTSEALKNIKNYLENNKNSKEAYFARAIIYSWDLGENENALADLDAAIEIDNEYALAYAIRGDIYYWDLGNSIKARKDIEKAISLSPEDPYVNYVMGSFLLDYAYVLYDKDKKEKAINYAEDSVKNFKKTTKNIQDNENSIAKRLFPFGLKYEAYTYLADAEYELYFGYKDIKKERKVAKEFLNSAISNYTKAIEFAPSQKEAEQFEIDRDFDMILPSEIYYSRGNAYSWLSNKWVSACKDWKAAKKLGNNDAKKWLRKVKC